MKKFRTKILKIDSPGGKIKLLVLSPDYADVSPSPGVLWIHGGGYFTGMPGMAYFSRARDLVEKHGAVVVSPDYRLAFRAPYPAALYDCHTTLVWLRDHSKELGIRSDQLIVGGESAGGGLAAALCMYEKDTGGVKVAFQLPLYPMLDNKDTESSRDNHAPVWNTRRNHFGWKVYLRGLRGEVPCYAAAARRKDYSDLPPAYTFVSTNEPFYSETVTLIENLRKAGVPAEIDVYPGLFHAFDMLMPSLEVSRNAAERFNEWVGEALERYFAKQES